MAETVSAFPEVVFNMGRKRGGFSNNSVLR